MTTDTATFRRRKLRIVAVLILVVLILAAMGVITLEFSQIMTLLGSLIAL